MATLKISEALMGRLQDIAERRKRSVEEIAESALEKFADSSESRESDYKDPLLMIAEAADELGLSSGRSDISSNFREVAGEAITKHFFERREQNDREQNSD